MIRVLLADDHQIVRDGLRRILAGQADLEVAAEAANGDEALALVRAQDFDVAVIDLSMPGLSGIDLVKRLRLEKPALKLLVLSMHGEQQYAARALKAGASGYLNKDSAAGQLIGALRKMGYGVHTPEGTFYLMVKSPLADDEAFAGLLAEYNVLVLPGIVAEMPGYFRISLTANDEMIERSLPGFAAAFERARSLAAPLPAD